MKNLLLVKCVGAVLLFILIGCSGEFVYRKDIKRLSKHGALDFPLTGFYTHYQYKFLGRYKVTHQWIRESNCEYRKIESRKYERKDRFFDVRDIFEEEGSTWQLFDAKTGNYNFDRYVRAEYTVKTKNGLKAEKGYEPICFQSWWVTSNYIRLRLQKRPLNEVIKAFNERYPEGAWATKTINNLTWHVQETSEDKFRPRPLNGVGGPFQTWMLPLADTGYIMAMELGASKESLQYPDAHARMQAMFRHLIESVKIEPVQTDYTNILPLNTESSEPNPQANPATSETKKPSLENISTTSIPMREYPEKTQRLQQDMQMDSNRNMRDSLRNTAPKAGR